MLRSSPAHTSPRTITPRPCLLSSPPLSPARPSVSTSRGGSGDDSGDAQDGEKARGIIVVVIILIITAIIAIISQMRGAKLELCPSPSGRLTVTNSSFIHSTHQLYTGQRRPERQEAAEAPAPRVAPPTPSPQLPMTAAQKTQHGALCLAVIIIIDVLLPSL